MLSKIFVNLTNAKSIVKITGMTKEFGQLSVSLADDIFLQNKFDVNDEILINWDKTKENSLQ